MSCDSVFAPEVPYMLTAHPRHSELPAACGFERHGRVSRCAELRWRPRIWSWLRYRRIIQHDQELGRQNLWFYIAPFALQFDQTVAFHHPQGCVTD